MPKPVALPRSITSPVSLKVPLGSAIRFGEPNVPLGLSEDARAITPADGDHFSSIL